MKKILLSGSLIILTLALMAQRDVAEQHYSTESIRLKDNTVTDIVTSISESSTNAQLPTALAVYNRINIESDWAGANYPYSLGDATVNTNGEFYKDAGTTYFRFYYKDERGLEITNDILRTNVLWVRTEAEVLDYKISSVINYGTYFDLIVDQSKGTSPPLPMTNNYYVWFEGDDSSGGSGITEVTPDDLTANNSPSSTNLIPMYYNSSTFTWAPVPLPDMDMSDLGNVDETGASNGKVLKYLDGDWVIGTDNTGDLGNIGMKDLDDYAETDPTHYDYIGIDATGEYENYTLGNSDQIEVLTGASLLTGDLGFGLKQGVLNPTHLDAAQSPTAGEYLKFDGTRFDWGTPSGAGTFYIGQASDYYETSGAVFDYIGINAGGDFQNYTFGSSAQIERLTGAGITGGDIGFGLMQGVILPEHLAQYSQPTDGQYLIWNATEGEFDWTSSSGSGSVAMSDITDYFTLSLAGYDFVGYNSGSSRYQNYTLGNSYNILRTNTLTSGDVGFYYEPYGEETYDEATDPALSMNHYCIISMSPGQAFKITLGELKELLDLGTLQMDIIPTSSYNLGDHPSYSNGQPFAQFDFQRMAQITDHEGNIIAPSAGTWTFENETNCEGVKGIANSSYQTISVLVDAGTFLNNGTEYGRLDLVFEHNTTGQVVRKTIKIIHDGTSIN